MALCLIRLKEKGGPGRNAEKYFRKSSAKGEKIFRIEKNYPQITQRKFYLCNLWSALSQFVFLNLVVNAAGRDSHESCGLRLIAVSEL